MNIRKEFNGGRTAQILRTTRETKIVLNLNLDPSPDDELVCEISTGIGFFDHMLEAFAKHAQIHLQIEAKGDLHIDGHHTVEDVGICLGAAVLKCLRDGVEKKLPAINRFGEKTIPLDEALCRSVVDFSGRGSLFFFPQEMFTRQWLGTFDTGLVREFFGGFVSEARCTLHLDVLRGTNDHHKCEALFKAFARSCKEGWSLGVRKDVPSTKGSLEGIVK